MRILFFLLFICFSITSYSQNKDASQKVELLLNEGAKFYYNQDYLKALNRSKKALSISLANNDEYHLALSYNLIGTIYNEFSQKERALNFYTKGLAYANKLENDTIKLWINSNIGNVYYYTANDADEGIRYYVKSLKLAESLKDSLQITFIRINIANAYFEIDKMDEGMEYIAPLRSYIEKKENAESKIRFYDLFGKFHSVKRDNNLAEIYFFKALNLAKENNLPIQLQETYKSISQHFINRDRPIEGEMYSNLAKAFDVDVASVQKIDTIEQVALEIELDEYKFQFERIELKNELQVQKLRESTILIIAFSVIMFILSYLVFTLYRNNKTRRRINNTLFDTNQELMEAKNRVEENSILKSQFISTVSHELRTPLYGVIGLTNIILEENKDSISQENLNSLRFSAQYLQALINDLLEINKAEEQKIVLNKSPFQLVNEIDIIKNSLIFMAGENRNNFSIIIDSHIPEWLIGDKLRLSQILINLISNGLRFTEDGIVKVELVLLTKNDFECEIKFIVSDTGIGIREEDQEKIFDKFVQIQRKQGDYKGTGLGLPIVKKLVGLFGGTISVKSEQNKGTTFAFSIVFEYLKSVPSVPISKPINSIMESELHFLVVEDNKINQIVTRKIIERKNFLCTLVESGYEAIELIKSNSFDVILMDINMPEIDGYETSKIIRELGIITPIIALTAFERQEVELKSKLVGIDDVIIKPFTSEILFDSIEKLLTLKL